MFIIVHADNISYDIEVSKSFDSRNEAEKRLKEIFDDLMEIIDEDEIVRVATSCKEGSYVATTISSNIFYGCIKEIEG